MDIWRVFGVCLLFSRLGFLGLLHMEVFNQRLEQEYNASVILTTPTVPYKAVLSSAKLIKVPHLLLVCISLKGKISQRSVHLYTKCRRKVLVIGKWISIKSNLLLVSNNKILLPYYLLKTNSCIIFLSLIPSLSKLVWY